MRITSGFLALMFALLMNVSLQAQITINEIRIDQTSTDDDEYFELAGMPGDNIDLTYVVLGDSSNGSGVIEAAIQIQAVMPASGRFLVAEDMDTFGVVADLVANLDFENSDNVTHMLVEGFSGTVLDDLDTDDDGVLETTPWTNIVDCVGVVEVVGMGEQIYCGDTVGPNGNFVPAHVFRCPDGTGPWMIGEFDPADPNASDTPGADNLCTTCTRPDNFACVSDCVAGSISLTWTNPVAYTNIDIYRDGAPLALMLDGSEVDFLDTTAVQGQSYSYEIFATCSPTEISSVVCNIDHCLCMPVTGLSATSDCGASNDLTLNWTNNGPYVDIQVFRDGALIATLGATETTYVDAALADGIYDYAVVSNCGPDSASAGLVQVHCQSVAPAVTINEVRIDEPGTDLDDYFELAGNAGDPLSGMHYIVIGDGSAGGGVVESVTDLSGQVIGTNGFFLCGESTFGTGSATPFPNMPTPDLIADVNFENNDNVTHMLVFGFTGALNDDLDTDDDGVLDSMPWTSIVDCVALLADPIGGDPVYCATQVPPSGGFIASHALICPGGLDDWRAGGFGGGADSPGEDNICPDCFEIVDFTCQADCVTGEVALSWTNGDTYAEIHILRNGILVDILTNNETSYVDTGAINGVQDYEIVGFCVVGSTSTTCSTIVAVYGGETHLVYAGETPLGMVDSAGTLMSTFTNSGESFLQVGSLGDFSCISSLGSGNIIWVCLGTYPENGEITQADGQALVDALNQGVGVYFESADAFAWDPMTPFSLFDGVDEGIRDVGAQGNIFDGDDSCTSVNGQNVAGLDLSSFAAVNYIQDSAGDDHTDQLRLTGFDPMDVDSAGTDVSAIFLNNPDMLPDPMVIEDAYIVSTLYRTDGNRGDVVCSSFEIGGLDGMADILIAEYVDLLGTNVVVPGDQFVRGECNGDGGVNIADVILLLGILFPGPVPPVTNCVDACDSNDDGGLNIADAITQLNSLFGVPAQSLPEPNTCGVDPTADSLDCQSYPQCP